MSPPITLAVIVERVNNLKEDLDEKHLQNRQDIHKMRSDIQVLSQQIWLVKLKIAGYAAGGGVLTGVVLKIVDHFWKS